MCHGSGRRHVASGASACRTGRGDELRLNRVLTNQPSKTPGITGNLSHN